MAKLAEEGGRTEFIDPFMGCPPHVPPGGPLHFQRWGKKRQRKDNLRLFERPFQLFKASNKMS